jgi:hypothetical protein
MTAVLVPLGRPGLCAGVAGKVLPDGLARQDSQAHVQQGPQWYGPHWQRATRKPPEWALHECQQACATQPALKNKHVVLDQPESGNLNLFPVLCASASIRAG